MKLGAIKGAIFDLDGTILDSMWIWNEVDKAFLSARNITLPVDYGEAVAHLGVYGTAKYTIERFGLTDSPRQLIDAWIKMAAPYYEEQVALKQGAQRFLKKLKDRGVKLGVATSLLPRLFVPCLKRCGVYGFFDAFATVNESRGKDSPDVYLDAAGQMNLTPPDIMVFEDVAAAAAGAKKGGFQVTGVYDPSGSDLLRQIADFYIAGFDEIVFE